MNVKLDEKTYQNFLDSKRKTSLENLLKSRKYFTWLTVAYIIYDTLFSTMNRLKCGFIGYLPFFCNFIF